jgi:hypothetical protein
MQGASIAPDVQPRGPRAVGVLVLGALAAAGLAAAPVDLRLDGLPLDTGAPEPSEVEPTEPPTDPLEELDTTVDIDDWERLADCESGDWGREGVPEPDSARWDYGLVFDHGDHFEGGLNFHPDTWEAFRAPDMPAHAGRASQVEEIEVAERVLDEQGWDAWPVCSEVVDLAE